MRSLSTTSALVRRIPPVWIFSVALFAATALAYLPAWHGQPIWDDEAHMTRPELRSLGGLARIWIEPGATQQYYPVVHSAFWLEHKLWGDAVLPYHSVNIALHAGSALLLFHILRRLKIKGAWLAAAIFALHPVHVESVAWISELKNTLSGFCALSAVVCYLRFDLSRRALPYIAALVLFSLGLMAKTVIATVAPALLVLFWWQRGKILWRRNVLPLLPFLVAGIVASWVTVWMERTQIGAQGRDFDFSFIERCLIAGRAFWFYLAKLLWPAKLIFVYPRWQSSGSVWWQYLFPLAALGLVAALWCVRRHTRAPLAAILIFGGMLFPALGFVNVFPFLYSFVADHFQYLASIAIISLGAAGIMRLPRPAMIASSVVLLGSLAARTFQQCHSYAGAEKLYRDTIAQNSSAWMPHNNLANLLVRSGRVDEAIVHYRDALGLRPNYVEARYNLGNALLRQGDVPGAIAQCEAAVTLDAKSAEAHNNLANALKQAGQLSAALEHYETALALQPKSFLIANNLAWLLATCRDPALQDHTRAVLLAETATRETDGGNAVVLHTLSAAYAQRGDFERALTTAHRAAQLAQTNGETTLVQTLQREISEITAHLRSQPAR
ncbi:MAG: tetratricopeptide repeat protein [Verrucomicrobiota bacterium]|nr:tetratricopeptide repeat protein [Verrucomicrobiota bacterium]